jgi:hypothetical protein
MAAVGIAVLAGSAICLQFGLDIVERGRDPAGEFVHLSGWFTLWSNTAVAVIAGHAAISGRAKGLSHPAMLAGSAVWIAVVGVIYNTLLAHLNHPPTLARQLIDLVFHTITPIAWPAWWLWGRPAGRLLWGHLAAVLPLPLLYCFYSLWMGGRTGRYAYFFIDAGKLGWGQVIINIIGLALFFVTLMVGAIAWDRARAARSGSLDPVPKG